MAHIVKCLYCGETFDADKEEFTKPRTNRYAHLHCSEEYEQLSELKEEQKKLNATIAAKEQKASKADLVKCLICGELIDRNSTECIKASSTRYAHRACVADRPEIIEKTEFFDYVSQLFGKQYDHRKTVKLAEKYMKDYPDWTWSGMKKAIWYFYEKKHGNKKEACGSIGILPYIYQSALTYFYELYMAELSANSLTDEQIKTETREITISEPVFNTAKRKAKIIEFEEDEE